ncbi:MAG: hypothetical protein Q7T84_08105 [Phenylobacterium sp.]|uniref:hypothetical protein n=1 Tax=Phenylobacterium sp. TaxID=1871053 RepID=UPI002718E744|nr:hypothetical protein [Phenylobacterium sp.]MDO9431250.1 hypothetical protein [Phenylobacterium sp.]
MAWGMHSQTSDIPRLGEFVELYDAIVQPISEIEEGCYVEKMVAPRRVSLDREARGSLDRLRTGISAVVLIKGRLRPVMCFIGELQS